MKKMFELDEEIVSTIVTGGYHYWTFKFPFRKYKKVRLFVATKDSIYEHSELE